MSEGCKCFFFLLLLPFAFFPECVKALQKIDLNNLFAPIEIENHPMSFNQYVERMQVEHYNALTYFTSNMGQWQIPPFLQQKVSSDGQILNYYGNTIVFPLAKATQKTLKNIQNEIRKGVDFFATVLSEENFHLTLHDLFHSDNADLITADIDVSTRKILKIFISIKEMIRENSNLRYIEMIPSKIIPSVNTSMVVWYLPKTEKDFFLIFNLYKLFDEIKELPYFFRPHITLDYFTPKGLNHQQLVKLSDLLIAANKFILPEIRLDLMELSYQVFSSMDHYTTLLQVKMDLPTTEINYHDWP